MAKAGADAAAEIEEQRRLGDVGAIVGRGDRPPLARPRGARERVREDEEHVATERSARAELDTVGVSQAPREKALWPEAAAALGPDRIVEVEDRVMKQRADGLDRPRLDLGAEARLQAALESSRDASDVQRGEGSEPGSCEATAIAGTRWRCSPTPKRPTSLGSTATAVLPSEV